VKTRLAAARDEAGFTIIEVMVAALILTIGLLGTLKMLDTANATAGVSQSRSQANAIARQIVETTRSLQYSQLTSASAVENTLKATAALADDDTSDSIWTIRQRSTTYTVSVFTLCTVDDGMDLYGDHSGGSYCSDSTTQGTDDANPDDYKRLTIRLSWKDPAGVSRSVRQTTLINNPGAGAGPSIRAGFAMTTPACGTPPASDDTAPGNCRITETTPSTDQATFTLKTVDPARSVSWSLNNVNPTSATAAGTCSASTTCKDWSFVWNLGSSTADGIYLVTAVATDETNNAGPVRALNVTVNRHAPAAVNSFIAGWNGTSVDFEWLPSPDNDIQRYRVYRVVGSADPTPGSANDVVVCDVNPDTQSCTDSSPGATGTSPSYYLAAYDLNDAGAERAGAESNVYTANPNNQTPGAPTSLACSPCTGVVTFTWSPSTDSDGTIAFYRIYRTTSTTPPSSADGYGRTNGATAGFQDSDTGTAHYYWVSAVDNSLGESTITGPLQAGG
jgi:type IV pilus modification protein PilV